MNTEECTSDSCMEEWSVNCGNDIDETETVLLIIK